jgi:hypothetical protein
MFPQNEYDPVKKVGKESPRFTAAWGGKGTRPTTVQRIGFGLLSIVCLGGVVMFGGGFLDLLRARQLGAIYLCAATLFFLFLALLGFRNVFRK